MNLHAMLDFESLSLSPDAVLPCAGLVIFRDDFSFVSSRRYDFPVQEQIDKGRKISASTLHFWSREENFRTMLGRSVEDNKDRLEALPPLFTPVHDLLADLSSSRGIRTVWTNGSKDVEWLTSLAAAGNREIMVPHYRMFREFRTIREIAFQHGYVPQPIDFEYIKHDPVDDAKWQLAELKGCFDHLGLSLNPSKDLT